MARARLLGEVLRVTIVPLVPGGDVGYDDLAEEHSASGPAGDALQLCANLDLPTDDARRPDRDGNDRPKRGKLVALVRDVQAEGWSPRAGDRITASERLDGSGVQDLELYVVNARESGRTRYGAQLVICTLQDRAGERRGDSEGLYG